MLIRHDLSGRFVVCPADYQWIDSPVAGVRRMPLDRVGAEQGRATSIVEYDAHTVFTAHEHSGGEEFFVLSGTLIDDAGHYCAGTYVRNPVGSRHTPRAGPDGARLFVKLGQSHPDDQDRKVINTTRSKWFQGLVPGLQVLPLHEHLSEHCALVRWAPHTEFSRHQHWGGEEILVLQGTFIDEHGCYPAGSWLRSPHRSIHTPYTREDGALIWVKTGHLSVGESH